jgi:hypothetical protein
VSENGKKVEKKYILGAGESDDKNRGKLKY